MTTPPTLSSAERKHFRGQAMRLKPAVIVGKAGVTPTVLSAIEKALARDGLIKLRLEAPDKPTRKDWLQQVATATHSAVCGEVGHTASIFRKKINPGPRA